ncbi:MAG: ABC transporter permease subunit [Tissierellia bacterium]|nr:ABC transporter permease subunit [Tissierellia bacterium]
MNRNALLYDDIGREYPRKNAYLIDLIELKKQGSQDEIRSFIASRSAHPHIIALEEAKNAVRDFEGKLVSELAEFKAGLTTQTDEKRRELLLAIEEAAKKRDFYEAYQDLDYEYSYQYRINEKKREDLLDILTEYDGLTAQLTQAKEELAAVTEGEERRIQIEITDQIQQVEKKQQELLNQLEEKKRQRIISKKAYKTEEKALRRRTQDEIQSIRFLSDRARLTERIQSLEHRIVHGIKNKYKVMEDNLSSIRRSTPIETEERGVLKYFATIPLPGLGQLLNGQLVKAIFFFLLGLAAYLIAVPYALGFGNYQGKGVLGLISLAEGAPRVHKSLIYMIEGIIAVILLVIAALILYLAFRDAKKVGEQRVLGIRPKSWYETKSGLSKEGLPMMVNIPALIMVVFIILVPIATALLLSFTGMDPKHQSKFPWVGLANYLSIATGKGLAGSVFWKILIWTIIWTIGASSLAIFIGFVLAIIANNDRIKGKGLFRSIFILPWAVPAFITIMFFSIMVSPNGILTELFQDTLGIGTAIKNSTLGTRVFLILLQAWLGSSYIFLLTTGVLQAIPHDLYEAAEIDGATGLQQTLKITIPLVLFQIAPLLVTQYTFNFNNFSIIFLFNQGGPFNPTEYGNLAGSSDILISYIYKLTMENQYQAMGAVITILISFALMVVTYIGFRNSAALKED